MSPMMLPITMLDIILVPSSSLDVEPAGYYVDLSSRGPLLYASHSRTVGQDVLLNNASKQPCPIS